MKPDYKKFFRPEVRRQTAYHLSSFPKAIKLNQNELPYDFPPKIKEKFLQRIKKIPLDRYPLVQPVRLKAKLSKLLGVRQGQILVSNGSNVMIGMIMASAAVNGTVMGVDPSFSLYRMSAESLGNRFIGFPLKAKDFSLNLKSFLTRLKKERPSVVFLANPNAPTGNLFPREALLEIVKKSRGLVVIDEAYYQFSKATLLPELKRYPNLILLRTFSKGYGLGGGRIGFLVAAEEIVEEVGKILPPYVVSSLNEEAALVALENDRHFQSLVKEIIGERERVFSAMRKLDPVEPFPSDANFILFRVKDNVRCFQHLLKKGVLVRDVSDSKRLLGCLRVTIGKPSENNAFLRALKSYR